MNEFEFDTNEEQMENSVPPKDIFAFNESRSCADLKRMHDKNQIDISPDFQREKVWSQPSKTRFLDSLLKNLPIPSMCISLDISSQKRFVIDGLQRISTVIEFLSAIENADDNYLLSKLDDIDERLSGKSALEIKNNYPDIVSIIENVSIPVTVLRCDLSKEEHLEYIFTIFHRLNTGGTKLNNQEIRNCIFSGEFNKLLSKCAENNQSSLKILLGSENSRFSYEEFILRFFAFQDNFNIYKGKLVSFLNTYMDSKKKKEKAEKEKQKKGEIISSVDSLSEEINYKEALFERTIRLIVDNITPSSGTNFSKTVLEAILYGVAKNIEKIELISNKTKLNDLYIELMETEEFQSSELQNDTLKKKKVTARLEVAESKFSNLE
ncbi:DUF262 domain-containing protein [Actinobacillus equuli]|uniref:DUF262 domain-containing protein n=1 Tax=Actinobacillus equuli TaxID=718 RepID=UPI0024418EF2|nr:DUF262 domain-containing protein [Actinobacillus equuli]WGE75061.1 DUF262 domain-containing protein [Actinobacillus equuli subsp. haemolyticus]WGE76974.1 DUF262 domain-containing protein [Actinobacillus equuli subsp. haemolyticus]